MRFSTTASATLSEAPTLASKLGIDEDFLKQKNMATNIPKVIGHRCALYDQPENTVPSLEAAVDHGAEAVEIDVFRLKCGRLAVFHGDGTDALPGGLLSYCGVDGNIVNLTAAEARELRFRGGAHFCPSETLDGVGIPLLEEFLQHAKDLGVEVKIELKGPGTEEPVIEMVEAMGFRLPPRAAIVDAGYTHAWLFRTRIVDAPLALSAMLDEIRSHGGRAEVDVGTGRSYGTPGEMADDARRHGCDAVANCTGLGARKICGDGALVGARGALIHYDRRSVAWATDDGEGPMTDASVTIEGGAFGSPTHPCYMIPRGDMLVVGGTYLEGDDEPDVRPDERRGLLENARRMGIDVGRSEPVGEWVGLRPYRPTCRLEVDEGLSGEGLRFVHSYGYGGSGWTVFVGAARDAASLLLDR